MKNGIKFALPISIGMNLDLIDKVEFILESGDKRMEYEYPSDRTFADGNTINLIFTEAESWYFKAGSRIEIDTRITLRDSEYQPETAIASVTMKRTLFEQIGDDE